MMDDSNKRLIYEEVKAVERDQSTVNVSESSRHGLMEITRKRVRPCVTFMISTEPCACCHATGRVEALETSFSKIEHEICRLLSIMHQKADPENAKSWPRFMHLKG
ncbi:ribonuclease E/G-like protein, chloroplastic [Primulina huaijiensis]|uniref:ribonuclease E/G-like protein, chloroplastic n=1 Tax=Primulina huaijiensis TaxID=1492673 RepID=UPI003CC70F89